MEMGSEGRVGNKDENGEGRKSRGFCGLRSFAW